MNILKALFLLPALGCSQSLINGVSELGVTVQPTPLEDSEFQTEQTVVASDNSFVYMEGERSKVDAPGILANDVDTNSSNPNNELFVDDWVKLGSFVLDAFQKPVRVGDFRGELTVESNGEMEYEAEVGGTGLFIFSYRACSALNVNTCDQANVTLTVRNDPNRPSTNPGAVDDTYSVTEGQTLSVNAAGFLTNDQTQKNQRLFCADSWGSISSGSSAGNRNSDRKKRSTSSDADADTASTLVVRSDGSFEYTAVDCWIGTETFEYKVCYENYPEMCSIGTVTLNVDSDRPDPANPQSDSYNVLEGEGLEVGQPGILQNDNPDRGQLLQVFKHKKSGGFEGKLRVHDDGSLEYDPEPGKLGTFRFTYEVCYADWDCVDCREATVDITVATNPRKPSSPPTAVADSYQVVQGEELELDGPGVLGNDVYDGSYSIYIEDDGGMDIERDGGIYYYGEEVGTETHTYTICYKEWPDLCNTGTVSFVTKPPVPTTSESRQGRATAYLVQWAGQDENDCERLEPNLTLTCAEGGYVSLLDIGDGDNHLCTRPMGDDGFPNNTILHCGPEESGMLYVECRDMQASNHDRRMLSVTMHSEPVECDGLGSTFHAIWLNTWCNTTTDEDSEDFFYQWANQGMLCSGEVTSNEAGETLCYEYTLGLDSEAQPADVNITSADYQQCFFTNFASRRVEETPLETQDGLVPQNGGVHLRGGTH